MTATDRYAEVAVVPDRGQTPTPAAPARAGAQVAITVFLIVSAAVALGLAVAVAVWLGWQTGAADSSIAFGATAGSAAALFTAQAVRAGELRREADR